MTTRRSREGGREEEKRGRKGGYRPENVIVDAAHSDHRHLANGNSEIVQRHRHLEDEEGRRWKRRGRSYLGGGMKNRRRKEVRGGEEKGGEGKEGEAREEKRGENKRKKDL